MKILMVYPQYPVTFWSFKHALKFVAKKSSYPPLGLLTVAEGVETEEQLQLVKQERCDQYQGFYFSPGLPNDELLKLLS